MDPGSIESSIGALIPLSGRVAKDLSNVAQKDSTAVGVLIAAVSSGCSSLAPILTQLKQAINLDKLRLWSGPRSSWTFVISRLELALKACNTILSTLEEEIEKIKGTKTLKWVSKAKYAWNEHGLRDLSGTIKTQEDALKLLLKALQSDTLLTMSRTLHENITVLKEAQSRRQRLPTNVINTIGAQPDPNHRRKSSSAVLRAFGSFSKSKLSLSQRNSSSQQTFSDPSKGGLLPEKSFEAVLKDTTPAVPSQQSEAPKGAGPSNANNAVNTETHSKRIKDKNAASDAANKQSKQSKDTDAASNATSRDKQGKQSKDTDIASNATAANIHSKESEETNISCDLVALSKRQTEDQEIVASTHNVALESVEDTQTEISFQETQSSAQKEEIPCQDIQKAARERLNELFQIASEKGNLTMMRWLISKGADSHLDTYGARNLRVSAVRGGHVDALKLLYELSPSAPCSYDKELVEILFRRACETPGPSSTAIAEYLTTTHKVDMMKRDEDGKAPIHFAAQYLNVAMIEFLVQKHSADINAVDTEGRSPFYIIADHGDIEAFKALNHLGASVTTRTKTGLQPIHQAASYNKAAAIEWLLSAGSDIECLSDDGNRPLLCAIQENNLEAVKCLLGNGAKANYSSTEIGLPIFYAARFASGAVLQALLDKDSSISIEQLDSQNSTPLNVASRHENYNAMKLLLDLGANMYHSDSHGFTALHSATQEGKLDAIAALLRKGADHTISDDAGMAPLHHAARHGFTDCVLRLLNVTQLDEIEATTRDGFTPLGLAVHGYWVDTVRALAKAGADINCTTQGPMPEYQTNRRIPMLIAIQNKQAAMIQLLTELGCDINTKFIGQGNVTSLMFAVGKGDIDIVRTVLNCGADVNVTDDDGASALDWACMVDSPEILKLLLSHGTANLNVSNKRGFRPIHLAAMSGTLDCFQILVEAGAELHASVSSDATQHADKTALAIASDRGNKDIVRYIISMLSK